MNLIEIIKRQKEYGYQVTWVYLELTNRRFYNNINLEHAEFIKQIKKKMLTQCDQHRKNLRLLINIKSIKLFNKTLFYPWFNYQKNIDKKFVSFCTR